MAVTKIPKKRVVLIEPKKSTLVDKEKYKQTRVAAYCRVSTDSEEQLNSYENQKHIYTEMIAAKKEWAFAGMYADEGISGTQAKKRPAFQKMIDDCYAGKIDYIITKSVSRFARNTVDCLDYVHMLKDRGIGIFFEEQNIDTLKTDSELQLIIYAGFAQAESESLSKNVTWSYRKNFEDGKCIIAYKKLLGYQKGPDGLPEIVPEEASIVKRIFEMFLAGMTPQIISDTLRGENIQVPGKELSFSRPMIMSVIRNEKYCGDCILQKTVTMDCISKKRKKNEGEAPMYIVENHHPAIIPREMFNRAQVEYSRRNTKTPQSTKTALTASGKYSKYALTEVLMCGDCGTRYKRVTWVGRGKKAGQNRVVWRCVNRLDYGTKYCKESPTLEEPDLKDAIVRALNRFRQEDGHTYMTLMKATIGEAIGLGGGSDEIELLERRIEALNKHMLSLVNLSIQDGRNFESNEDEFRQISDEISQLKERIVAIQESQSADISFEERLNQIQVAIDERDQDPYTYDDAIVRQMIECIKVFPDKRLEIYFGGGHMLEEYAKPN